MLQILSKQLNSFFLLEPGSYFSPSLSVMMGPTEIPSQSSEAIKIPTAHYEFGANFIDQRVGCHSHIFLSKSFTNGSSGGLSYHNFN
jgi:hypothetical protein